MPPALLFATFFICCFVLELITLVFDLVHCTSDYQQSNHLKQSTTTSSEDSAGNLNCSFYGHQNALVNNIHFKLTTIAISTYQPLLP